MNKAGDARHVCRWDGCSYVIEPCSNAHTKMVKHVIEVHNSRIPDTCRSECGYRAKPSEGRYNLV